jgi:hypothetical protein
MDYSDLVLLKDPEILISGGTFKENPGLHMSLSWISFDKRHTMV